jgi:RNA polymerase sigma-70 factor, ECF subfamily
MHAPLLVGLPAAAVASAAELDRLAGHRVTDSGFVRLRGMNNSSHSARAVNMGGVDGVRLTELFDAHAREILGFLARRTSDPEAAVDLLAETFASAFEGRREFRGKDPRSERAWLFAIARNLLADHYRSEQAYGSALQRLGIERRELTDAEYGRIEELAGTQELRGLVADQVERLPNDQQDAVRLRLIGELSYVEIAEQLGITQQAARARVSRGLRTLRAAVVSPVDLPERTC